jgi:hypothetical protein
MIKICKVCQHENHPQEAYCANCGEDISRVKPVSKEPAQQTSVDMSEAQGAITPLPAAPPQVQPQATRRMAMMTAQLVCEPPSSLAFTIAHNATVGREPRKPGDVDLSLAPSSEYISRQHATFILQGNKWLVRAESATNPTWVNDVLVQQGMLKEINANDRIKLAMTTFIFRC